MSKIKLKYISQNRYTIEKERKEESKKIKLKYISKNKRSIPGIAYVGGKIGLGALGLVEGTTDLIVGGLADLFGNDEFADYMFQQNNWVQDLNQKLDEAYNPGKVGRFVGDVASGLGQSATFLIPYAGQVMFLTGVAGNAVSSASQTTGEVGAREYIYGATSAALEWALERYISGTGQTLETVTKTGAKNVTAKVFKSFGKTAAKNTTGKMIASQLISSAVGEGIEEFFGNIGDVGLRKITGVDENATIDWGNAFYDAIVGMTSGALLGGASTGIQSAYEAHNGAQINADTKRRDTMLTQARGLVKMAKEQSLDKGSDAVAAALGDIEAGLSAYENAKKKDGAGANIALGKINRALIKGELNIITDRHAEYIASLSDAELEQLAEYANAYFKEAGVEVTAKDLKDINNQVTRALATLDWAGKVVNTMIGTDRILNEEVIAKMEEMQVDEETRAKRQSEKAAEAELARIQEESAKNVKPVSESASWNGEKASYHGYLNGAETTMHIEKRNDGAYQAFFITEDGVRPVKLTEDQVKAALAKMTDTENRAEENKSSEGEREGAKEEKQPETKENQGESGTKLSLEESFASRIDSWDKKTEGFSFIVGQTSSVLQQIEVGGKKIGKKQIRIDASKIKKILSDHKEMTIEIFKKIPEVLESPILVLESKTVSGRIVLFGELYDDRGRLIQIIMELNPSTKSGKSTYLDVVKIASAYAKDNAQNLINTSKILYVDKNRSRVEDWLKVNRLQLPLPSSQSDSASEDSISHSPEKSNTSEENSPKSSLGPDSVPVEERGTPKKAEEYVETEFKATPEEVKAAMKAVKQFKLLDAETREAIINMMRSAAGIDKVTVQSIAAFMAVRSGLHVRFMKDHRAEGSHDILKKSGRRLILLDPSKMNGKHWRADIFFHELYHDMAATGDLKGLTKAIYDTAAPAFQHAVADLYTAYHNKGVSISQFLDGQKWTEARVKEYFDTYKGISFDAMMEEVAAGTIGRVMGSKKFIRSLRQVGALKRVFYGITNIVQAIANRAITVGGDNTAGFTLTFRDALAYKALYSRALIEAETHPSPEAIAKLKKVIEDSAERDEDRARTKMSLDSNNANKSSDSIEEQERKQTISDTVDLAIQNNGNINEKYNQKKISKFPENVAEYVEAATDGQVDVSQKYVAINGNEIWHEYRSHENQDIEVGRHQIANTATNIKEAIEAIYQPDVVEGLFTKSQNVTQRQSFVYAKKSPNGYYIVVEAVGGKQNPNVVPVMILQFDETKWNDMMVQGKVLGELLFENDPKKYADLDISKIKKNRVTVAQFASRKPLQNSPHSPRSDNSIPQPTPKVNSKMSLALESIEEKYKPYAKYLSISENGDQIKLHNIVLNEVSRNQGVGQAFLNDLIEYADREGKIITLTPTREYGTHDRLKKWYKRNGFVENKGRNTDFRLSDTMYRLPANSEKVNTKLSLSLDGVAVTKEEAQRAVDAAKWNFEWTDEKLLDNINAVRRYLGQRYPDAAPSIQIDNENKRVIITDVSRFIDFDKMATYDAAFADFLRSIGVQEEDIEPHLTAFTPSQKANAVDTVNAKNESEKETPPRPRAYYKNQVKMATEAILEQVITPLAGGETKMIAKDKKTLIGWIWKKMNAAANRKERQRIATVVADAFISRAVYADVEVNEAYEDMLVSGVIEDFDNVRSYLGKIRAESVSEDVLAKYDSAKGRAVLKRWISKDGGISVHDAVRELQDQGLMTDVTAKNEADLLIALNEEYERLKGITDLRREFVPLSMADEKTLAEIRQAVSEVMMGFFRSGGKETKYGKLARRYQELLAQKDAANQKEIAELEARLTDAFEKRVDRVRQEADRRIAKAKERFDRRLTEANYGRDYAKRLNRIAADVRNLRDYVNRDYTAASDMEDRQTKGIAKAFLKATTRTGVKAKEAREAARILLSWADKQKEENEDFIGTDPMRSAMTKEEYDAIRMLANSGQEKILTDKELEEFHISREQYEAAMEARRQAESLSLEELENFHTALKVAIRNYKSYDMLWNGERWVDLNEEANTAVTQAKEVNEEIKNGGWFKKIGQALKKIAMPFLDPLSVAAAIDGYRFNGVFQQLIRKLAYAEAEKNKRIIELRAPFEEFLKQNPKYQKRLSEAIIELEDGVKITVGQAISLIELNKRDQAKTALAISRIVFRMDDGTVQKLEGFDKLPQITTPSGAKMTLIEAKDLIRELQIGNESALAALKAKGYTERTLSEFEQAVSKAEAEAMPLIAQFGERRQQLIAKVEKQLNAEDRAFIKVVSDFFQKTSKEAKTKADLRNLGYTNVIEGYYFPIKRRAADIAKDISDGTPFADFITTVNLSFNQSIVPNAKASLDVVNVWDVVAEHINGLAMWEHLYLPIQNINKIYNKNINAGKGTSNVLSVKSLLDERTEAKYGAWLKDLLLDVQGARQRETKTFFDTIINKIRGTYAVYQLGFNPQTVAKQTLSWAAAAQYLSPTSIAKGLTHPKLNSQELDRVSAIAAERMGEATVVKAMSNTEKVSKLGEKTMWGISKMDRFVNEALFAMCQHEVAAKDPKKPIGSEENLIAAGKLVSEVILNVQDSSDITTKSQAARSSNELLKAFTMFQSAGLKMFSRIFENVGFVAHYQKMSASDQAKYGTQYKKAQKQLARSVGSAAAVAVLTAVIVQLFKTLYNKDREDEEGNEITVAEDLATDAATELVGFIPVVGDVVDYFVNGYEVSNFFTDTTNDTLKALTQAVGLMGKVAAGEVIEDWEVGSMLRKVSRAAGSLTGIPVRNVENVLSGLVRRVSPEAGYTYDTLFYRANYSEDINKALKEGDTELAGHILSLMIKRDKTGGNAYSDETIDALIDLRDQGFDVFPKTPDYEKLDRKSLERFEEIYQKADAAVEKLVKSEAFKAMANYGTDELSPQATAIKTLYNGFFDLAEHDVLNEELSRSAAYFTVTDEHDLMLVKAYDKAIKLETVELKGSRKAMLKAYMKSLGMDKTAQAYAAYACGYRTDEITSVIYDDLKGREDEKEILIALGLIDADEDKKEDEAA